jgi:hypothetical protein
VGARPGTAADANGDPVPPSGGAGSGPHRHGHAAAAQQHRKPAGTGKRGRLDEEDIGEAEAADGNGPAAGDINDDEDRSASRGDSASHSGDSGSSEEDTFRYEGEGAPEGARGELNEDLVDSASAIQARILQNH